jgi:ABC-type sulfate/molybdate transport systems ATPase subunit
MSAWRAAVCATLGSFRLDVDVDGGSGILALIGPNGSGKTTFLRALAGAIPAETAEIVVADQVLESTAQGICLPIEHRRVGYVPQGYGLFPHLSVLENVAFGLSTGPARLSRAERNQKAQSILRDLDCAHLADRRVRGLSGGEQQRVALARALVLEPRLLLLDEPLRALDATNRRSVRSFLAERIATFSRPTVLVTHDVRDVEALEAVVVVLEAGRIVQRGSLDDIKDAPASEFVAEFIGSSRPSETGHLNRDQARAPARPMPDPS